MKNKMAYIGLLSLTRLVAAVCCFILPAANYAQKQEMIVQNGTMGEVRVVSFAQYHPILASSASDNTVNIWHWQSGKKLRQLMGHSSTPGLLKFLLHDSILVTAGVRLIIWSVTDGSKILEEDGECFDVDEQNALVLYTSGDTLRLFDLRKGNTTRVAVDNRYGFISAKLLPHSVIAVAGGEGYLELYKIVKEGMPIQYFRQRLFSMPPDNINALNDSLLITERYSQDLSGAQSVSRIINIVNPKSSPRAELPGYYSPQWSSEKYFMTKTNNTTFIWRKDNLVMIREVKALDAWFLQKDSLLFIPNSIRTDFPVTDVKTVNANLTITDLMGRGAHRLAFPALARTYLDVEKTGKTFLRNYYVHKNAYVDSTILFDDEAPAKTIYIPGKYVGYDEKQQLIAVVPSGKKNTGAFSVYRCKGASRLLKTFEPVSFDYPVFIHRTGDTLTFRTNNEHIIQYDYDESLGKMIAITKTFTNDLKNESKLPGIRINFERETDWRTDSVVLNLQNQYGGALPTFYVVRQDEYYFLANYSDTLIYFNAATFKTKYIAIPPLSQVDHFDKKNNVLRLTVHQDSLLFINLEKPDKPLLKIARPVKGVSYVWYGEDYVCLRIDDSLAVYNIKNHTSYLVKDNFAGDIAGHLKSFDVNTGRTSLLNITSRKKITLDSGTDAFPVLRANGTDEQNQSYILLKQNDTSFKVVDAEEKLKARFVYTDPEYRGIWSIFLSNDEKFLFTVDRDNIIHQWDFHSNQLVQSYAGHTGSITSLLWIPESSRLYSSSTDGSLKYWATDGSCVVSHYIKENEWMSLAGDGYYTCSRGAVELLAMTAGFNSYAPAQIDAMFNRPDILMHRLGVADSLLTNVLYKAFLNRSPQSAGFSGLLQHTVLPTLELLNSDRITDTTAIDSVALELGITDSLKQLGVLYVTVNDQLVHEEQVLQPGDTIIKSTVRLTNGSNTISAYILTNTHIKSYIITRDIFFKPKTPVLPNIYFVGMCAKTTASNNYRPLVYAEKDGDDIKKIFQVEKQRSHFAKLISKTFYGKDALRSNLFAYHDTLMQSKIEDMVILFLSGHGQLADDGKFYFVTYDFSDNKPESSGISLADIQTILKDVPARKKVLLIDACNSGVENPQTNLTNTVDSGIGFFNKAAIISLLQNAFVDLNNLTGYTVIAASSSTAQQDSVFENGVFTHVLRLASTDRRADTNNDGMISLNELKRFLLKNVYPLSFGNQTPIIVSELLNSDFTIFHLDN